MPVDPRPYITLDYLMPKHDKVQYLSADAFRLLVTAWCYCAERDTDGLVVKSRWERLGPAKARQELLEEGLAEPDPRGVMMHDYLKHQLSRAERAGLRADRIRASTLANHKRWHKNKGVIAPDCEHCPSAEGSEPDPESFPSEIPLGMPGEMPGGIPNASQTSPKVTFTSKAPSNASRSQGRKAAKKAAPDPATDVCNEAYEAISGAADWNGLRTITRWALKEKDVTPAQFVDAVVGIYREGKPVTKQTVGQYIDGHKRQNGPTGKHSRNPYLEIVREMEQRNLPEIGA